MTLSLPPDLDARIQQKVTEEGYQTPDEVIRKALDALDAKEQQEASLPVKKKHPTTPVWQRFQNAVHSIPEEELATLPSDGASEHDYYLQDLRLAPTCRG